MNANPLVTKKPQLRDSGITTECTEYAEKAQRNILCAPLCLWQPKNPPVPLRVALPPWFDKDGAFYFLHYAYINYDQLG
jgi:hypothetical protein